MGDHVFLRISPTKGVMRFGFRGKLSPRFVGPFEVLERMGKLLIGLPYHLLYQGYIMFSMSQC